MEDQIKPPETQLCTRRRIVVMVILMSIGSLYNILSSQSVGQWLVGPGVIHLEEHDNAVTIKVETTKKLVTANTMYETSLDDPGLKAEYYSQCKRYRGVYVEGEGNYTQRIEQLNWKINELRIEVLRKRESKTWQNVTRPLQVVWGAHYETYVEYLTNDTNVISVFLPWANCGQLWTSLNDTSNFIVQKYYLYSASQPLCSWIYAPMGTKQRYDLMLKRQCSFNLDLTVEPRSLEPLWLNTLPPRRGVSELWPEPTGTLYPAYLYDTVPNYVHRIHIFQDLIVTNNGDIITGDKKYVSYTCGSDLDNNPPRLYTISPIYSEVFVMTQYYAGTFYHSLLEDVPRIAPFLQFLRNNTNIKIHAGDSSPQSLVAKVLGMLGIDSSRIIAGLVRARVAYVPRSSACGWNLIAESQLLAQLLQNYLHDLDGELSAERNTFLLIRRSGNRRFLQHDSLHRQFKEMATAQGLRFEEFSDRAIPPTIEIFRMFHQAVIIVGPHGAGFSNLLLCRAATVVIEGVCNRPHVNLCYLRAAHTLGLRWHGVPSMSGCENVIAAPESEFIRVVEYYIPIVLKMRVLAKAAILPNREVAQGNFTEPGLSANESALQENTLKSDDDSAELNITFIN